MSRKIKLGVNATTKYCLPVAVPRISEPATTQFDVLDVKQYVANSPDGLVVSDDDYTAMMSGTNLRAMIAAGLVIAEGAATVVRVETAADGSGVVVTTQNVVSDAALTAYAISRDVDGNFVANVAGTWTLTGKTGSVVDGDLAATVDTKSAVFTAADIGTCVIHLVSGTLTAGNSGTLTVIAGAATTVYVETAANGSGTVVGTQNIVTGHTLTAYAVSRDAEGNFVANVAGTWTLTGKTGTVADGDLVAVTGTKSAVFTGAGTGTCVVHLVSGALTAGNSGTLTVTAA